MSDNREFISLLKNDLVYLQRYLLLHSGGDVKTCPGFHTH